MTIIVAFFLRAPLGPALGRFASAAARFVAALAPLALSAAMLAVPADEARADSGHPGDYPLHCAAGIDGDLAAVVHLLGSAHRINVNARPPPGYSYSCAAGRISGSGYDREYTPLHEAARYGRATIAAALIAAGADLEAIPHNSHNFVAGSGTPLHYAARNGHAAVATVLIAAGAEVNAKTASSGETPLHWAAHYGRATVVAALIAAGADLEAIPHNSHNFVAGSGTPLHYAARFRRASAVGADHAAAALALIAAGAKVNAKTNGGRTPLHSWAGKATIVAATVVAALIAAGAEVNAKDDLGETPLHGTWQDSQYGFFSGGAAIASVLIAAGGHWGESCGAAVVNPAGPTPPCLCESPNVGTADSCQPPNPSVEICGGFTPPWFYDATAGECEPFVECHATAMPNADNSGCECAPGDYAHGDPAVRASGAATVVYTSAECHADHAPLAHDLDGWEAAITMNDPELVSHFIAEHGQNPDANYELHLAAENDYHLAAMALLAGGANPDLKDGGGDPPLHLAARASAFNTAKLLLQRGANPDATDSAGDTALHEVAGLLDTADNVALVSLLLDKGANPNIRNNARWRPLDVASGRASVHPGESARPANRKMMAALTAGGATWSDECTGGKIPNEHYRPPHVADCKCPTHLSEDNHGVCECPGDSHAQVNRRCLAKDSPQVNEEIEKMRAELESLWAELTALNARLTMLAADAPLAAVEAAARQAARAAREIAWRRENFIALGMTAAAGPAPRVALADTEATCRMLDGDVQIHSATGGRVCSGIDHNDTFCIVASASAFPCAGLFRHVRRCNDEFNRPALDPWHCAARCPAGKTAKGAACATD